MEKKTTIIAIAGVYRSRSTWQFNVVKQIILKSGYTVSWNDHWDKMSFHNFDSDKDFHIIKTHEFYDKLKNRADLIFTSTRSFDDVKKSYSVFNPRIECTNELIKDFFVNYGMWLAFTDYDMKFEDIKERPEKVVKRLAKRILKDDISDELVREVLDEVNSIKPPQDSYKDSETLLFRNHIGDCSVQSH